MKLVALKRVSSLPVKNGLGLSGSKADRNDPRYIRITDIGSDGCLREDVYASQPRSLVGESWVKAGDVLIASVGATVGKSYLHRVPGEYCFAGYLSRVRPNTKLLDSRFLYFWTQSKDYWKQIYTSLVSSTIENLSASRIGSLSVPLPPLARQRAIADFLASETAEIDASIADQFALIELAEERRQSTIDSYLYASGSRQTPLKHLGRLRTGITLGTQYDEQTQEYPYLRVANVQTDRVDLTDIATVNVPPHVADANRLVTGDVLMTEGGDRDKLGRGALWHGEVKNMLHQNHIFTFRCNENLLPEYLVYVLESSKARYYFDITAKQSTNLASTNSTTVKRFRVPFRRLEEQRAIVASLDIECTALGETIADAERTIELSRERRVALISAAVTGQIDVTQKRKPVAEVLEDGVGVRA